MPFVLIVVLSLVLTLTDIVSAWLYVSEMDDVWIELIQYLRIMLTLGLGLLGLGSAYRARWPFWLALVYVLWIGVYLVVGGDGLDTRLVVASATKLILPPLLLSVGYAAVNTAVRLRRYALVLGCLAVASTAFGAWDIGRTEFWTDTLQYGHYLYGVKGITMGFDSYYVLPFNFFGYENMRRAAGLVAAPLAQGSFVAIGAMAAFAALLRKSFPLALLFLLVGIFGVWQSGTRGAMLVLLIALPIFLFVVDRRGGTLLRNVLLLVALVAGSYQAVRATVDYSVNLQDGSTIGHVDALRTNLEELHTVILRGEGLGAAGAVPADGGDAVAGGGEGAVFSIAYQIGVPAAVVFMCFYAAVLWRIFAGRGDGDAVSRDIALASVALGVGFTTTFISSDHLFSLSGMGVFWILLGGAMCLAVNRVKVPG